MQQLSVLLVDDEESARDVLENLLLRFCPQVTIVGKCENLPRAVEMIRKHKPQLVFLDIEMPNYAGFEIVKFFDEVNFEIVFVTAYDQYAVHAFELSAIDYLLKPIAIERLKSAINRAEKQVDLKLQSERLSLLSNTLETRQLNSIMVIEKGYQQLLPIETIIAIEAQESYCIVHTDKRKYTVSKNLKHFEQLLESRSEFVRIHKSWMINVTHLIAYSKSDLIVRLQGNLIAKLSKYKKADFEELLLTRKA